MLLSNKALQETKKTQDLEGKIWKTTSSYPENLWSKWKAFVKFMRDHQKFKLKLFLGSR